MTRRRAELEKPRAHRSRKQERTVGEARAVEPFVGPHEAARPSDEYRRLAPRGAVARGAGVEPAREAHDGVAVLHDRSRDGLLAAEVDDHSLFSGFVAPGLRGDTGERVRVEADSARDDVVAGGLDSSGTCADSRIGGRGDRVAAGDE